MRTFRADRVAATLPLVTIPIAVTTLIDHLDAIPDFVRGLVYGVSIALLLGFCVYAGTFLGVSKRAADDRWLDDLDPLRGLPRDEDEDDAR